jgi:hypothetical protein
VGLAARRPRIKGQLTQARQLGRVGHLGGLTADHHAPASLGRRIGPVDLERNPAAPARSVQLRPLVGAEHHHVTVKNKVHRNHDRPEVIHESHPPQMLLGQQTEALRLRQLLPARPGRGRFTHD